VGSELERPLGRCDARAISSGTPFDVRKDMSLLYRASWRDVSALTVIERGERRERGVLVMHACNLVTTRSVV
jgi:hypothetical protein